MTSHPHARARASDGAFFEDWSLWASLDDLPQRPLRSTGERIRWGHIGLSAYSRYYCVLRHHVDWMGGPCFEIHAPVNGPIQTLIRRLPAWRRHPRAESAAAYIALRGTHWIPAEHWREVRQALPAIKAAVIQWSRAP